MEEKNGEYFRFYAYSPKSPVTKTAREAPAFRHGEESASHLVHIVITIIPMYGLATLPGNTAYPSVARFNVEFPGCPAEHPSDMSSSMLAGSNNGSHHVPRLKTKVNLLPGFRLASRRPLFRDILHLSPPVPGGSYS